MLSHDLQNLVADVSAAIAASETFGRVELEKLRRNLNAARREAARTESQSAGLAGAVETLVDGIESKVVDLTGLARHLRAQFPVAA